MLKRFINISQLKIFTNERRWQLLCLLLACNYFAYRTEMCEEEFENNNPLIDPFTHQTQISRPTLNWEKFDKDNAPKAFVFLPPIRTITVETIEPVLILFNSTYQPYQPIRDKSPPVQEQQSFL